MTLKGIVKKLKSEGHKVSFVKRKDGSIRVTKIDGRRYSARLSEGNAAARALTGQTLSGRQIAQRESQRRHIARSKKPAKAPLSPEMKRLIRKTQRQIRKHSQSTATVSTATVRKRIGEFGEEETKRHLRRISRHFEGYAYEENVRALYERVHMFAEQTGSSALEEVAEEIEGMEYDFLEAWIAPIYEIIYQYELMARANPNNARSYGDAAALSISAIIGR